MPLRDHFSESIIQPFRWEGFHATWPVVIMQHLNRGVLPEGYHAVPRVRLGTAAEVDVGTREGLSTSISEGPEHSNGAIRLLCIRRPNFQH